MNVKTQAAGVDTPDGMTYCNTKRCVMPKAKIAISLSEETLASLDRLVREKLFANRSQAIESAVEEKIRRLSKVRLVQECSKLDPAYEKELAEEGFAEELLAWPEY